MNNDNASVPEETVLGLHRGIFMLGLVSFLTDLSSEVVVSVFSISLTVITPQPTAGGTPSTISAEDIASLLDRLGDPTANELTAEFNRGRRGAARVHVEQEAGSSSPRMRG